MTPTPRTRPAHERPEGRYLVNANSCHIPLADSSINMVATSFPYWGLRSYLPAGHPLKQYEIGTEKLHDCAGWVTGDNCGRCFVCHVRQVAAEIWRVLHPAGVLWLNLGDSYARSAGDDSKKKTDSGMKTGRTGRSKQLFKEGNNRPPAGLKAKDLVMIPARVALALQADGWWVRSDVIWQKPNAMPESVTDRPSKSHEYIFLLTKSESYFYDQEAAKEGNAESSIRRRGLVQVASSKQRLQREEQGSSWNPANEPFPYGYGGKNKRTVWTVPTNPYPGAHFACWPPALVEPMIKAGSSEFGVCPFCRSPWKRITRKGKPEQRPDNPNAVLPYTAASGLTNGLGATTLHMVREVETVGWQPTCKCPEHTPVPAVILDPFAGSGTTIAVARKLGRVGIGLDLNFAYLSEQAKERTGLAAEERFVNGRTDTRDYSNLFTLEVTP